jgi:hypothetical protein
MGLCGRLVKRSKHKTSRMTKSGERNTNVYKTLKEKDTALLRGKLKPSRNQTDNLKTKRN